MSVLMVALPAALFLAAAFAVAFVRAVRQGQFDDLDTPALRPLADDPPPPLATGAADVRSGGMRPVESPLSSYPRRR